MKNGSRKKGTTLTDSEGKNIIRGKGEDIAFCDVLSLEQKIVSI